jgi:hypothetical protein
MWNFLKSKKLNTRKQNLETDKLLEEATANIFHNWTLPWTDFKDKDIIIYLKNWKSKNEIDSWTFVKMESIKLESNFIDFATGYSTLTTGRVYKGWVRIPTKYIKYFNVNECMKDNRLESRSISFFVDLEITLPIINPQI